MVRALFFVLDMRSKLALTNGHTHR
jgi:hypothetical protein